MREGYSGVGVEGESESWRKYGVWDTAGGRGGEGRRVGGDAREGGGIDPVLITEAAAVDAQCTIILLAFHWCPLCPRTSFVMEISSR